MFFTITFLTQAMAAGAVATAIAVAPGASALPIDQCNDKGAVTVCESPGNADIVTEPPSLGSPGGAGAPGGFGNGPYGPSGSTPPVGGNGP